jgi:endonuclease/exonuclease/phosphatase (EEP) superfamily protein YafD
MKTLRRIVALGGEILLWATGIATVAGFASDRAWLFDLCAAFRPAYFLVQTAGATWLAFRRRWFGALTAVVLLGINSLQMLPLYLSRPEESMRPNSTTGGKPAGNRGAQDAQSAALASAAPDTEAGEGASGTTSFGNRLRVVQLNLAFKTRTLDTVVAFLRRTDADLVALEEVGIESWQYLDKHLAEEFPYRFAFPLDTAAGLAILSKRPFKEPNLEYFADPGLPSIVTEIRLTLPPGAGDQPNETVPVGVVVTHPLSPTTSYGYRLRDAQLREIARHRSKLPERMIVLGDLNITSWSAAFGKLLADTGLRDTRVGFGVQPSWPAIGLANLALVPIDHVLVSHHFRVIDRRVGSYVGSDHLPVVAELEIEF